MERSSAIVEHLGADLGRADQVWQLRYLGQREAARRRAVQEPGDVGLAGAREVVVLLHRPHLRSREALDRDAAAGILLKLVRPFDQPLRHGVLVADEIGELHLDRLRECDIGARQQRQRGRQQAARHFQVTIELMVVLPDGLVSARLPKAGGPGNGAGRCAHPGVGR